MWEIWGSWQWFFFFLFCLSLVQKAVSKWVAKRSLAICVVKFLTFLDKYPVRGIFKIYATFNITGAKKALFFSAFLSKAIHLLSLHFSLLFLETHSSVTRSGLYSVLLCIFRNYRWRTRLPISICQVKSTLYKKHQDRLYLCWF